MLMVVLIVAVAACLAAGLWTGNMLLVYLALGVSLAGVLALGFVLWRRTKAAATPEPTDGAAESVSTEADPRAAVPAVGQTAVPAAGQTEAGTDQPTVAATTSAGAEPTGAGTPPPGTPGTRAAEASPGESTAAERAEAEAGGAAGQPTDRADAAETGTQAPLPAAGTDPEELPSAAATDTPSVAAKGQEPAIERPAPEPVEAKSSQVVGPSAGNAEGAGARLDGDRVVRVVPGRRRFHMEACRLLDGKQPEEISLDEAREEGFTACTSCIPDRESLLMR